MAWTVQHGDYGRIGVDWPVLLRCSLVLAAQCPHGQTLPPPQLPRHCQISLPCRVNSILIHFVLWAGVRRSLHMGKGHNAISRLPGCSILLWQEQVEVQLSSLFPRTRLPAQPGSRAGKRFQQPGKPAEQRREVKPAQLKGDTKLARLCFIALLLGQQAPAGKDWELVLLGRSHWASGLLRLNNSLKEERLRDITRTKIGGLCNGIQLNGWHTLWGEDRYKEKPNRKTIPCKSLPLGKWGLFRIQTRSLVWASLSFFIFENKNKKSKIKLMFEHECYCSSQPLMIFLRFFLSRLQPIHDSACCNPLPWASFTCKPKSLQPKLVAVMSPESSAQLVNGNTWVAEVGIKLCSSDALHSGHWAVWCAAHLSLQHRRFSWCEVASL